MSTAYFQKNFELPSTLKAYKEAVENQKNVTIQCLALHDAGEQSGKHFKSYAQERGISLQYFPAYESQSNGFLERLIQELWKAARIFIFESKLDLKC